MGGVSADVSSGTKGEVAKKKEEVKGKMEVKRVKVMQIGRKRQKKSLLLVHHRRVENNIVGCGLLFSGSVPLPNG